MNNRTTTFDIWSNIPRCAKVHASIYTGLDRGIVVTQQLLPIMASSPMGTSMYCSLYLHMHSRMRSRGGDTPFIARHSWTSPRDPSDLL